MFRRRPWANIRAAKEGTKRFLPFRRFHAEARYRIVPPAQDIKVFWFFSSENNFFLPYASKKDHLNQWIWARARSERPAKAAAAWS
jgi:hypothetical protein